MSNTAAAPPWAAFIPEPELAALRSRGFGADIRLGRRPCLLVIDTVLSFLGDRPDSAEKHDYVTACGSAGWEALPNIVDVLEAARDAEIPVVMSKGSPDAAAVVGGAIKLSSDPQLARQIQSAPFPAEVTPRANEFVLEKTKASAFFLTPLLTYVHQQGIDSFVVVGATTSGCVRATVVDAASYGFPTLIVSDACFDRSAFAHAANLFDMQMKYGSVVTSAEVVALLR